MGIKTKTVCVKKQQRKLSKVVEKSDGGNGEEAQNILIDDTVHEDDKVSEQQDDNSDISMESMVHLQDPSLTPIFVDAIAHLKHGHFKQAEEKLLRLIRYWNIVDME